MQETEDKISRRRRKMAKKMK